MPKPTCPGPPAPDSTSATCGRGVYAKGLCRTHRYQQLRRGDLIPIRSPRTGCDREGCEAEHHGGGLCRYHFDAQRKRPDGSPRQQLPRRGPVPKAKAPRARTPKPTRADEPTSAPKPSVLPAGWDKVTPPKVHTRTRTSARPDALGQLTPLDLGIVGATLALLERHHALDLADTLGLREMAAEARARLAVAS